MACYSKSLEDYFRIPILIKPITVLSEKAESKLQRLLYYKHYHLFIDEKYQRAIANPNTEILRNRSNVTQSLYFVQEDFINDWPEFQIIYKIKFSLAIIDEPLQQKQIDQLLTKLRSDGNCKLIGVLNLGSSTYQNLFKKENIIKCPELNDQQFLHFIEPWLYDSLSLIQSQICNSITQAKRQDESNRTIVFNRLQQKFQAKIMKKKKKYRCIKLCADYLLTLQLAQQAFAHYKQAEELLKKIDDYLWILGCLQGKLACIVRYPHIQIEDRDEYIQDLIEETYSFAKKAKIWSFQCQNYFKIIQLYVEQPEKVDQLVRNFLISHLKNLPDSERFLLYLTLGSIYEKSGLLRKKNYYFMLSALLQIGRESQASKLILIDIQKSKGIRQWPQLYKKILQLIIREQNKQTHNQFYLELLSSCSNHLTQREINELLDELNYTNNPIVDLQQIDFVELKEFSAGESSNKPKQNRIGNRESPRKVGGGGFFMSWKREENLLYQQEEGIVLRGSIQNKIPFPIRVKLTFQIHSLADSKKKCGNQQICLYLQASSLHKFQTKIQARGQIQQIWMIDKLKLSVWNFQTSISLNPNIKYQVYEKQSQLNLQLPNETQFQETSLLHFSTRLVNLQKKIKFCVIKLSIAIYYSIDVGFQENQIVLRDTDSFMGMRFDRSNIQIEEGISNQLEFIEKQGVLRVSLKKFKTHRKFISRIEFNLQYLRTLNSKYQISKQYIMKCNFSNQFSCSINKISTPMLKILTLLPLYNKSDQIIENDYVLFIQITNNRANDHNLYTFTYDQQIYTLQNENILLIQHKKAKIQRSIQLQEIKQLILWRCPKTGQEGELQLIIPVQPLLLKPPKNIFFNILQQNQTNFKAYSLQYKVTSDQPSQLSHSFSIESIDLELCKTFVLRGKTKVKSDLSAIISNKIQCLFPPKTKGKYRLAILFEDGWTYHHENLLELQ